MMRAAAVVVLLAAGQAAPFQAPSERDAERMATKLQAILDHAERDSGQRRRTLTTSFSEAEVNAYLAIVARPGLPPELLDPTITIADRGRVAGRARIDLDRVRKSRTRGALDPLAYVSGQVEVTLGGTLEASRGRGRFTLESATLGGVAVPKSIVQELVTYFTKTPELPDGIDLDRPFDLPARIVQVRTGAGRATIVQ
jgi:hypothetical protein